MKAKFLFSTIGLFFISLVALAQQKTEINLNPWSEIPTGVYKLSVRGEVRVTIIYSKTSYYDFGTDLKKYIASGQEKSARSFVSNGTLTITPEITGAAGVIRIFLKEPLIDIEVSEGGLVMFGSKITQPSMNVRLNNSKLFSEKRFSVNNFVLENHQGIIELKNASLNSAVMKITPGSKNNFMGKVSKQQMFVIEE